MKYVQRHRGARKHGTTHGTLRLQCSEMELVAQARSISFVVLRCSEFQPWEVVKVFQGNDTILFAVWKACASSSMENGLEEIRDDTK